MAAFRLFNRLFSWIWVLFSIVPLWAPLLKEQLLSVEMFYGFEWIFECLPRQIRRSVVQEPHHDSLAILTVAIRCQANFGVLLIPTSMRGYSQNDDQLAETKPKWRQPHIIAVPLKNLEPANTIDWCKPFWQNRSKRTKSIERAVIKLHFIWFDWNSNSIFFLLSNKARNPKSNGFLCRLDSPRFNCDHSLSCSICWLIDVRLQQRISFHSTLTMSTFDVYRTRRTPLAHQTP